MEEGLRIVKDMNFEDYLRFDATFILSSKYISSINEVA